MIRRRIRPEFYQDVAAAAAWYESNGVGIGDRFLDAVDRSLDSMQGMSESYPLVEGEIRVCKLRKFPYGIYFHFAAGDLTVLGLFHLHRDSNDWSQRLPTPDQPEET